MIETKIIFTDTDAIRVLRNAGLEVKLMDVEIMFDNHPAAKPETISMWMVINPYTKEPHSVKEFFSEYLNQKKKELFLQPDKIQIFNLFNNPKFKKNGQDID